MPTGASATCSSGRSPTGDYRLEFALGSGGFFERVSLDLHITDAGRSYHVPLLKSGFALTTYRGS